MDAKLRSVIMALAIGDGYLQHRQGEALNGQGYKYTRNEYCLSITHGPDQKAYCQWKANMLTRALGGRKITIRKYKNGPGGRYWAYKFSKSSKLFKPVHRLLYPNGVKTRSRRVLDMLDLQGVAIWYLDDGSARRNINKAGWTSSVCTDLATCCSKEEAIIIRDWFMQRWGIEWKLRYLKKNDLYLLQCTTANSRRFIALIAPYVPDCMKYKISHVADLTAHERQIHTEHRV